jgi:thioredoxin reductase
MRLKSEGYASSLADPKSEFTLAHYCHESGLPYQDTDHPVPLETFVAYGLAFQKKFVPNLEKKLVVTVRRSPVGFELLLDDKEIVSAHKVIVSVGIAQFSYVPSVLSAIPSDFVSHSSAHSDLQGFRGRQVAVVGGGSSAMDLAALLDQAGASVKVIARRAAIRFHNPPKPRTLRDRLLNPMSGIGAGADLYFYANAPYLFRWLPEKLRLDRVRKTLGPAPGWFIRDEVVGRVPIFVSTDVTGAWLQDGRVQLQLIDGERRTQTLEFDHVIAATGYRIDIQRLSLLGDDLRAKIRLIDKSPRLSANFESSVPGLYFVGVTAANTFGPVLRFAFGTRFTARRLSRHLAKSARRSSSAYAQNDNVQALDQAWQGAAESSQK